MSYFIELLGWAALHNLWQASAAVLSLSFVMRAMRAAPGDARYRCAKLHFWAAFGAVALTVVAAHASMALHRGPSFRGASSAWLTQVSDAAGPPVRWIVGVWIAGAVLGATMLAMGCTRLHKSICSGTAAARRLTDVAGEISREAGLACVPEVCVADVRSPLAAGWRTAYILLPRDFEATHPPAEVRALLAHEIAHVRRRDFAANLLQLAAACVLWWHPAIWFLYFRIRHERECCTDEQAIRWTGSAVPLACALLRLASAPTLSEPVSVAARSSGLADRIERMERLRDMRGRAPRICLPAAVIFAAVVVVAAGTAWHLQPIARAYAQSTLSPATVFTIQAQDPAGRFSVEMVRGRVIGVALEQQRVRPDHVLQNGETVRVVGEAGQELLRLEVDPRGGCRWNARRARSGETARL